MKNYVLNKGEEYYVVPQWASDPSDSTQKRRAPVWIAERAEAVQIGADKAHTRLYITVNADTVKTPARRAELCANTGLRVKGMNKMLILHGYISTLCGISAWIDVAPQHGYTVHSFSIEGECHGYPVKASGLHTVEDAAEALEKQTDSNYHYNGMNKGKRKK